MRVLYLYSEVMGYTTATIQALVEHGDDVSLVYWDKNKLTPISVTLPPAVNALPRSEMTVRSMVRLAEEFNPELIVVSGWMDKGYLLAVAILKMRGFRVITGLDQQWFGGTKQQILRILGGLGLLRVFFSGAWVCGAYQYEFARKLGIKKQDIAFDLYSADVREITTRRAESFAREVQTEDSKKFVFVGRLEEVKGLRILADAWRKVWSAELNWTLQLIGAGSLEDELSEIDGVELLGFMQPNQLFEKLSSASCFVLPSLREPWGVVVHEFVAMGKPVILSDVVGASSTFMIDGCNGYQVHAGDADGLAEALLSLINASERELAKMGAMSEVLAQRITPEISAASLRSLSLIG